MKKHQGRKIRLNRQRLKFPGKSVQYLLESGTLNDMRAAKQITAALVKYQWDYYAELAYQRNAVQDEIKTALVQTCISYTFSKWQRAIKYKYCLHPLSTIGSLSFIGGRFNTGSEVNREVPIFPSLYLAQDKDTALQEHLGQEITLSDSKLTSREIALAHPSSEAIVSVSGKLDKVFDLTSADNLTPFVDLIKNFKLSDELRAAAKFLMIEDPDIVKDACSLQKTLLHHDWRQRPSNYDVPANSQIFGHLIYSAGIEGILYPSKLTQKPCLAVFLRNFVGTDSFVMLDDEVPHLKVPRKIDGTNWRISELEIKEIIT
ncbi:MAG TPA: RES family NAD+ phosphorylase [Gammaproteobacteria bacterium]|jgi:hypothetical protein|nr:RES family NAD+ phosphorylase [Gammaproteobacteria bacterium]